ncbi:MAG: nicotinate (nicotinamide) nucleotide adenylyltransferase [Deltaproteobacteria bacterium]|nr:nicotinate (nicotinamide) nucleotide adenylyltransferase [Deltaproteobacteria bacterium]
MRVGIYGGSFNPPHVAHVLAAAYVLACREIDRVLVIPTFQHPFAKSLVSFADRVAMCRLAFADLSRVEISTLEEELGGESRTVRTLEHLQAQHPDWRMRLVVGADVVHELDRWWSPERVKALAPPLVLGRLGFAPPPGFEGAPSVLPEVSSTAIRAAFSRHAPPHDLVPRAVIEYAQQRRLYD